MAAVMTIPRAPSGPAVTTIRQVRSRPGDCLPGRVVRSGRRPSVATFRRRRVAAAVLVVASLGMAGKAGAALGGFPLAAPERHPAATRYVVEPGDSLWSIAQRIEPDGDPRPVVDELSTARAGAPLVPGEIITWSE
jgi:LysM domain